MAAKRIPLEGHQFGILTVREFVGFNERRQSVYRCECLCGETRIVRGTELTALAVRRCGPDCKYERPKMRFTFATVYDGSAQTKIGN
jgi:hypothetical protein